MLWSGVSRHNTFKFLTIITLPGVVPVQLIFGCWPNDYFSECRRSHSTLLRKYNYLSEYNGINWRKLQE